MTKNFDISHYFLTIILVFSIGYQVKMGYGLHFGWSIEGAIGSIHKVAKVALFLFVNPMIS